MIQILDKYGNTSTDDGRVIIVDKFGQIKKLGGSTSPTGPAGGDLSGTYPNPSVIWVNGEIVYDGRYYPLSTNPAGYLTSSALAPYLTSATAALTYYPIPTGTTSQYIRGDGSLATFTTYALPIATSSVLGGVKIGTGVSVALDGTISVSTNYQAPLSGSGIVKSTSGTISYISGTSSQFVKGDGSLDSSTYLTTAVTSVGATSPITSSGGNTPIISTSMATNKLIGRSTLGVGVMEEITVGSGLTLSGGTLTNTATPTALGYYGAFQDILTQTLALANVGQPFLIRTVDESNQVSITANGSGQLTRITPANTGVYNIQWSGQFQNPDNAIHDVNVWFRKGLTSSSGPGTDIVGSNGLIAMPARKSAGAGDQGHVVAGWNFLLSIAAGEYVEFYWMSDSTQITLQAYSATSPPPSTASLIVTVTQQSGIMAGTGITAINSLTGAAQTLTTGTTGTDFNIVDSGVDHKFNLPTASATNTGKLSNTDWNTFNGKQNALSLTSGYIPKATGVSTLGNSLIQDNGTTLGIGAISTTSKLTIFDTILAGTGLAGTLLDLQQTWNTPGNTPTAISLNVTDTASAGIPLLMDLKTTGASKFSVAAKTGNVTVAGNLIAGGIVYAGNTSGLRLLADTMIIRAYTGPSPNYVPAVGFTAGYPSYVGGSVFTGGNYTGTNVETYFHQINGIFAPTSGTGTNTTSYINPTINQTVTATGITRGIHVNPILTSAVDFRAIETAQGKVVFSDTISSGSGSLTGSLLNLSQTWNTTGVPTALKLNVTNSASGTGSLLMDLQVGGLSKFNIDKTGIVRVQGTGDAAGYVMQLRDVTNTVTLQLTNAGNISCNLGITQSTYTPINNAKANQTQISGPAGGVVIQAVNASTVTSTIDFVVGGFAGAAAGILAGRFTNNGNFLLGTTTDVASSKLTVASTTQGFLPPRMTNAQRIAIASPAVGLMVYCTDATEGVYVNKSTGWVMLL